MRALSLFCLMAFSLPAGAETLSAEIGRTGLKATAARLEGQADPDDSDRFALAGVRFLGTVETALQTRWNAGLVDPSGMLPFLRVPIEENPSAPPLDPAMFTRLFSTTSQMMEQARAPLQEISQGSDFVVEIRFSDIWFDINADLKRDPGEDMMAVMGPMLMGWQWDSRDPAMPAPVVKFDAADAAWLSAYTHMLQGFSDVLLAYDPTEPIARIMAARDTMTGLGMIAPDMIFGGGGAPGPDSIDIIATVLATLQQQPDKGRMAAARDHFLAMIADNRRFWAEVETETDNADEWLPNDRQKSALGIEVPQGTGAVWMGVLSDAEDLLNGKKLAPYWRFEGPAGVNVAKIFTDPRPIDVPGWIQGWAAVPYLEQGEQVSWQSLGRFSDLVSGDAMLFSLYLN